MKTIKILALAASALFISLTASAQKYGKTAEDSVNCITNISLYSEFYKQANYKDAYKPWREVFLNCPMASENTFIRGATILKYAIDIEKDAKLKEKRIDTLLMIWDKRIEFFGKEGLNLGKKANDLLAYRPKEKGNIYNLFKKAIEISGNYAEPIVMYNYCLTTIEYVKTGKADSTLILDNYDFISDLIEKNMANDVKNKDEYDKVLQNIEKAIEPYTSCQELVNIYNKKFKQTPNDISLLKKITKILDKKKCTEDPLFFKATENLYKLEPTPETAYLMGKMSYSKKQYAKAAEYLNDAVTKLTENSEKARVYLLLADIYGNLGQNATARTYAYKALEAKPGDGMPYIIIGDLYAQSAKACGDNELTTKVAFWAAVDKYNQAKKIDSNPKIIETANNRISSYSRAFPSDDSIFFYGLKKGDSYKVGCWINETTTVR
jgi:tetratricopeptide (TPR) repeat protein